MKVIYKLNPEQVAKIKKLVELLDDLKMEIQPDNYSGLAFLDDDECIDFCDLRKLIMCYNLHKNR
jgi:hypothetical protein